MFNIQKWKWQVWHNNNQERVLQLKKMESQEGHGDSGGTAMTHSLGRRLSW